MHRFVVKILVVGSALCFVAVLPAPSVAQGKDPVRDPQALALLAECGAAMGAASIQASYATGTLTTSDPEAPAVPITSQTKGAAERYDMASQDSQTYVMNGGSGWAELKGKQAKMPYAFTAFHRPEHVPALACVLDMGKANMAFQYVGKEL